MLWCMRTTIRLDDELLLAVKRRAAEQGRTITRVIEDALRATLAQRSAPSEERVVLPTLRGGGVQDGVDLLDSRSLRDIMDGIR